MDGIAQSDVRFGARAHSNKQHAAAGGASKGQMVGEVGQVVWLVLRRKLREAYARQPGDAW